MRYINTFMCMSILAIFVAGCSVSENTVGGSAFQKRRYTKGFYHSKKQTFHASKSDKVKGDAEAATQDEAIRPEVAVEENLPALKIESLQATAVPADRRESVSAAPDRAEKSQQRPVESRKAPSNKKQAGQKEHKPAAPVHPKKERENDYFVPVKDKKQTVLQKKNSHANSMDDMQLLAIIFAILIPPVGVAIYEGITVRFWISLLLTILFFFPGMIYALLVVCGVI